MIYTQAQQDSILYQSQVWMADRGVKIEALERSMQPCDDLYCELFKVRMYITAIQRSSESLADYQKESIYSCLVKMTGIKDYPVGVPIAGIAAPSIITGVVGPAGPAGANGSDGSDAFIDCISEDDGITIETEIINNIRTFKWTHTPYVEPWISLALDPSAITEIGNVLTVNLNMTLTKGRDDVTASVITSDGALDTTYQALLDLAGLNAGGASARSVVTSGVIATTAYTVNISDESPSVVKTTASRTLTFVYPFFDGVTAVDNVNPYSGLAKNIVTKSNKSVDYNDTDKYFWFCYPASYGALSSIKDQNGFEVFSSFTRVDQNVVSTGLTNNWDVPYYCYRTTAATDINGTFTFSF